MADADAHRLALATSPAGLLRAMYERRCDRGTLASWTVYHLRGSCTSHLPHSVGLRLPGRASGRASWRHAAACKGALDPDAWFPTPTDATQPLAGDWRTPRPWAALAVCAACPVRGPCLAIGMRPLADGAPTVGIWGGTTDLERALLLLAGWQPGQPAPAVHVDARAWVSVRLVAAAVGISREAIHLWARDRQIDSRPGTAPTGQPERLVCLDEVRARAARARPARFQPRPARALAHAEPEAADREKASA